MRKKRTCYFIKKSIEKLFTQQQMTTSPFKIAL